jgi:hypothetical protein
MAGPRFALRTGTARPVENEFGFQTSDHEEALAAAEAHGDSGSMATRTISPRWHRGHCRREEPTRPSYQAR